LVLEIFTLNLYSKKHLLLTAVLAAVLGFGGGWIVNQKAIGDNDGPQIITNQDTGKPQEVDFALFWKVWNTMQEKYVNKGELNLEKMVYGAISGMVNSAGDPYTVFFEPENSKKFQEEISGAFGGVGIEIGKRNGVLTVIAPIKDTPAERAGILAGEKILKIDNKATGDLSIEAAVTLIRGKKGSKVTLTIANDKGVTRDIQLTRDTIKVPTIKTQMIQRNGKNYAYIQIYSFNQNVDAEFKKAAEEIVRSNASGLIVDLRNNPGGLLDSSIYLAGWFMEPGKIVVSEVFNTGLKNDFESNGSGALKSIPTVLLVNGGSASASEILAGALHDNRDIKIVGEKTFGKGSVQELETFDKGSSLKVTIAKWLTPAGISISEKGIEPDVKVEVPQEAIESGDFEIGNIDKDPQLQKAFELLP